MGSCCSSNVKTKRSANRWSEKPVKASVEGGQRPIACFDQLPSGKNVENAVVRNVYDGDTLYLEGEGNKGTSVRLLGIDAPEIKPLEPYALESRDYLRQLCPARSQIFLVFNDSEREDRYGRLLAYIYVRNTTGNGYICANVALVEKGLASLYRPGKENDSTSESLKAAQDLARKHKCNLWKDVEGSQCVLVSAHGIAFHRLDSTCITSKGERVTVDEALNRWLSPCRNCKPLDMK